jgi:hypothetical protein
MTAEIPPENPPANDHPSPEVTAVIAATISFVLGRGARIVSVIPVPGISITHQMWALEGRRQIYATRHPFRFR